MLPKKGKLVKESKDGTKGELFMVLSKHVIIKEIHIDANNLSLDIYSL